MLSIAQVSTTVLALASFAQATITIGSVTLKGNTTNTIQWSSDNLNNDPTSFSIELANPTFNKQYAVANNIPTTDNSITFQMPSVLPGPGYSVNFVNPGNISDVFATSNTFSIAENDVSSASAASTVTSGTSASSGVSAVASTAAPAASSTPLGTSSTPLAVTPSATSPSSTDTSAATSSPSSTPNNAMELTPSGFFAAFFAGAIALLF